MRTISTWRTLAMVAGMMWVLAASQAVAAKVTPQDLFQAASQLKLAAKEAKALGQALKQAQPDEATIESAVSQVKTLSSQIKNAQAVVARHLRTLPWKTQFWFEGPLTHIDLILEQLPFILATDRDLINASGTLKTLSEVLENLQGEVRYMAQRAADYAS
ncbi:MAG: hypothetical protein OZSIB_2858 [Candidatus Ozemobacter sibiricus]|uniref:Uncharacterized protein n=1 Tax=Candidatus Ozemobacter sibiricus TaxID=2268124 RepID=A0A367ZIF1_9BACT|nr:MAG: hypothetical protein OZSIB_2858 [Candidatus Ozemobacter sibiricus]